MTIHHPLEDTFEQLARSLARGPNRGPALRDLLIVYLATDDSPEALDLLARLEAADEDEAAHLCDEVAGRFLSGRPS